MQKTELSRKLQELTNDFVRETEHIGNDPYSKRPVTEGELVELKKQIFYVLDGFMKTVAEYLD